MKIKSIVLSALLIASSLVSSAQAGIINVDYLTLNDNKAVYDEATGLTWLDLTVTAGYSIFDAEAMFTGYSVASTPQIQELFAKFDNTVVDMQSWYSLFGSSEDGGALSQCFFEVACSYGASADNYVVGYGVMFNTIGFNCDVRTCVYDAPVVSYMFVSDGATTKVPEPSTLAVFALGMIGLASRRFKKQS